MQNLAQVAVDAVCRGTGRNQDLPLGVVDSTDFLSRVPIGFAI